MTLTGIKRHVRVLESAGLVATPGKAACAAAPSGRVGWTGKAHGSTDGRRAIVSTPSDREARVERIFDALRDRVWRAMTDPELIAQWWGRGNRLVVERYEPVRGGHWRFVEHEERDGMMSSGMETAVNQSYEILARLLATLA